MARQHEGGSDLLIVIEFGYGKRTPWLTSVSKIGMSRCTRHEPDPKRTGKIVSACYVYPDDEVTIITAQGIIMRTAVDTISRQGRYSQGVRVMGMKGKCGFVSRYP